MIWVSDFLDKTIPELPSTELQRQLHKSMITIGYVYQKNRDDWKARL